MVNITSERLTAAEYIGFLARTDLGSQYPRERFGERIPKLLKNVSVSLAARNEEGLLVGVLLGLTDFAYWLYVTDLGVDRAYERLGIGRALTNACIALAKKAGYRQLELQVVADNAKALNLYKSVGFVEYGRNPKGFRSRLTGWQALVYMRRELDE